MLVRAATLEDAAALAALIQAAFEEYRGRLTPPSSAHAETEASVRRKLASAAAAVALADNQPVGCIFFEEQPGRMYLSRLAVRPEHRRRGLGLALVEFAEAQARAHGLGRACLGVRVSLERQRDYYTRLGYRCVGTATHPGFETPTYVLMEKEL